MGNLQVLCLLFQTALVAIAVEASSCNLPNKGNSLNIGKKQRGSYIGRPISDFDTRAWSPEPSHIPAFPLLPANLLPAEYYARTVPQRENNSNYDAEAPEEEYPKTSKALKDIAPFQKAISVHGSGKASKSELTVVDSKENFSNYNLKAITSILSSTLALLFLLSVLNYFARLSETTSD